MGTLSCSCPFRGCRRRCPPARFRQAAFPEVMGNDRTLVSLQGTPPTLKSDPLETGPSVSVTAQPDLRRRQETGKHSSLALSTLRGRCPSCNRHIRPVARSSSITCVPLRGRTALYKQNLPTLHRRILA
ncbi:unnamed protein product [Ectocarpus sp. 4 AP-2014]